MDYLSSLLYHVFSSLAWIVSDSPVSECIKSSSHHFFARIPPVEPSALIASPAHRMFVKLGALAAASAYFIAAYGKHIVDERDISPKSKQAYQTGKNFQYISAMGLLMVPFSCTPLLTGTLFTVGMLVFSGSCYYYALNDIPFARQSALTPAGSMITVCAWLTFLI